MQTSRVPVSWLTILSLSALASCSKSATSPSTPPTPSTTIRITSAGASPRNVEIALGARVLFINDDTRAHDMVSDPHPEHTDCPVINQVGLLRPGEQRETGNFVAARTCGFHDHDNPADSRLRGSIVTK